MKVDKFIETLTIILEDKNNIKISVEVKEKAPEEVPVPSSAYKIIYD